MTTTVNKTTPLYDAFWDVLLRTENAREDCLFEGTASMFGVAAGSGMSALLPLVLLALTPKLLWLYVPDCDPNPNPSGKMNVH